MLEPMLTESALSPSIRPDQVAAAPLPASQAPLSSLQLLPLPSRSRRKPSPCPLLKIQCKDIDDRSWIIVRAVIRLLGLGPVKAPGSRRPTCFTSTLKP